MKKRVSTAAYLAGVTTLAVSLPMMASARAADVERYDDTPQKAGVAQSTEIDLSDVKSKS